MVNSYRGLDSLERRLNNLTEGEEVQSIFSWHNWEFILITYTTYQDLSEDEDEAPPEGWQYWYNYDENSEIPLM